MRHAVMHFHESQSSRKRKVSSPAPISGSLATAREAQTASHRAGSGLVGDPRSATCCHRSPIASDSIPALTPAGDCGNSPPPPPPGGR